MIDTILEVARMRMITNIVAGIILFFILRVFFQWLREMYHISKVRKANTKVMALLKPYATSGTFPSYETFNAVVGAVANDHRIECEDVNSLTDFFQEFIKEILENEYIPSDRKIEYTNNLSKQMAEYEKAPIVNKSPQSISTFQAKRNNILRDNLLNICVLFSSIIVALVGKISNFYNWTESFGIFIVVAFALLVFVDQGIKKKRYRDIPRFLSFLVGKLKAYNHERKRKKQERKSEKTEQQFTQAQIDLVEGQKELEQYQNKLRSEQIAFETEQERLALEYKTLNDEKNKLQEEQQQFVEMKKENQDNKGIIGCKNDNYNDEGLANKEDLTNKEDLENKEVIENKEINENTKTNQIA